ncbi:hypothetical protein [Sorangium sp. So ce145]|uniref:hypothetical protein n=1 Tax=Sorangium sp. So ce145 TaxID=3133285 RepID=UPI003F5ED59C
MIVTTKLSLDQVKAEAQKFGLTTVQIDKFTFQVMPASITVVVYPGHADTAKMNDFLKHLVSEGLAFPIST